MSSLIEKFVIDVADDRSFAEGRGRSLLEGAGAYRDPRLVGFERAQAAKAAKRAKSVKTHQHVKTAKRNVT